MLEVKVIFANGDNIVTGINGTRASVTKYYLNRFFNIGSVQDNMQKCVKVIFL